MPQYKDRYAENLPREAGEIAVSVARRAERGPSLPPSLAPRGLSRTQAAAYIGVSPTLFDELVADGRMPKPKRINARTVWDIRKLDLAFDAISDDQDINPWDGQAR